MVSHQDPAEPRAMCIVLMIQGLIRKGHGQHTKESAGRNLRAFLRPTTTPHSHTPLSGCYWERHNSTNFLRDELVLHHPWPTTHHRISNFRHPPPPPNLLNRVCVHFPTKSGYTTSRGFGAGCPSFSMRSTEKVQT